MDCVMDCVGLRREQIDAKLARASTEIRPAIWAGIPLVFPAGFLAGLGGFPRAGGRGLGGLGSLRFRRRLGVCALV